MKVAARPAQPPDAPARETACGPFVLSFDFEDWHQLAFRRRGREDWRVGSDAFTKHVRTVLHDLDEVDVRATFFVMGATAERHPWVLQDVVARGHEVACHGYEHRRVDEQTAAQFRDDLTRCVDVVTEICGVTPVGFRAPWFSITSETPWVHDILEELGFVYDSSSFDSLLLRQQPRPIPRHPFRIGGVWEFPVAVWKRGGAVLPLGGGSYWRALPAIALWRGLASVARDSRYPVLYFHPYEFAPERLGVIVPERAPLRVRGREAYRRAYRNARRRLIPIRFREAARRFTFVSFRDALDTDLR